MAIKLRSQGGPLRKNLSIKLYGQDIAEEKFKEWQETIKQSFSGELSTEAIDQVPPPNVNISEIELKVTHVSSPSVFWIHYGDEADELSNILFKVKILGLIL